MKNLTFITVFLALCLQFAQAQVSVDNCTTEMLSDAKGIDVLNPRLGWQIKSSDRNVMQTGYQLMCASTLDKLEAGQADLWNSGKINATESIHIRYAGKQLMSRSAVWWKVKVFTSKGESDWSMV